LKIAEIFVAHQYFWTFDPDTNNANGDNSSIVANATRTLPAGGTVHYISWQPLGYVYPGAGTQLGGPHNTTCSDGSHTHVEVRNTHDWGLEYEWHSTSGPDYFTVPSDHLHSGWGSGHDFVAAGSTRLGLLGYDSYQFYMDNNPYSATH
jgi:hypothetical protein